MTRATAWMSPEDVLSKGRQTQKATPPTGNVHTGLPGGNGGRSARGSRRGRGGAGPGVSARGAPLGLMGKFWVRQSARVCTRL